MDSNDIYSNIFNELSQRKNNPHYLNRYVNFIKYCSTLDSDRSDYFEKHHILPVSLFPQYKRVGDTPWNLIKLTAREHYIIHWILAKAFGGKLWYAFNIMNISSESHQSNRYKNSYFYEKGKIAMSVSITGKLHPSYGKTRSKETRLKISKVHKGKCVSEETKKRMSKSKKGKYGRLHSEETKKKIGSSHNKIYKCPHCNKNGGRGLLQFHFDRCFIIDESKNMFEGISPIGETFLFGSVKYFCEDHELSMTLVNKYMNIDTPCFIENNTWGQKAKNTVGWKFIQLR
jgi:hypothetical protein